MKNLGKVCIGVCACVCMHDVVKKTVEKRILVVGRRAFDAVRRDVLDRFRGFHAKY